MMILRSLLGIAVLTAVLWLFSSNKRKVNWAMVGKGLLLQFVLALAVLKVPGVSWAFEKFSLVAVTLLDFTREGSTFLFGSLITETDNFGYLFAFQALSCTIPCFQRGIAMYRLHLQAFPNGLFERFHWSKKGHISPL